MYVGGCSPRARSASIRVCHVRRTRNVTASLHFARITTSSAIQVSVVIDWFKKCAGDFCLVVAGRYSHEALDVSNPQYRVGSRPGTELAPLLWDPSAASI